MVSRSAGDCPHRTPEPHGCRIVAEGARVPVERASVAAGQCEACCEFPVPGSAVDNPVTSSLLFDIAGAELQAASDAQRRCDLLLTREVALRGTEWGDPERVAVRSAHQSPNRRAISGTPNIGLVGFNSPTGLGYANRDFARELGVARWLIVDHPGHDALTVPELPCQVDRVGRPQTSFLQDWLSGLDWLLFIETPLLESLPQLAVASGVRVACIPDHEWLCPITASWLEHVDLMLCPVRHAGALVADWARRFGGRWRTGVFPWPIDADRFPFKQRTVCERFLFVNGQGGSVARDESGKALSYRRKGLEQVIAAARLAPEVPLLLATQAPLPPGLPTNIELLPDVADNRDLYLHGDICLQPSHWEGIGLPLLECQAAGLPLATTDAPPMNEFQPFHRLPVRRREPVVLTGHRYFVSSSVDPVALAAALRRLYGVDIRGASQRARWFIETEHSWARARQVIFSLLASGDDE